MFSLVPHFLKRTTSPQNPKMAWVGKDLKNALIPPSLPWTGTLFPCALLRDQSLWSRAVVMPVG